MIKILAIGNSFSQDTTSILQIINPSIFVRNLYIGGCSIEHHCECIENDLKEYEYQENGAKCTPHYISLKEALLLEDWDFITVQEVSSKQGCFDGIDNYLGKLLNYIETYSHAKVFYHQTWAYEQGSDHPGFLNYHQNEHEMLNKIKEVTSYVNKKFNLPIIPVGEIVDVVRKHPLFDYKNGGLSLNRDSYMHLSINYGRFLGGLVWSYFFTNSAPNESLFTSNEYEVIKTIVKYYQRW